MSRSTPTHRRFTAVLLSPILRALRHLQNRLITIDVYAIWASAVPDPQSHPPSSATESAHERPPTPLLPVTLERPVPDHVEEPFGFAYRLRGRPICTINIRSAKTYRRATLDLLPSEAKLIDVVTAPEERGKGLAPCLIREASDFMKSLGYERIYARIWHSNHASQRAFAKAGWRRIGTVFFVRGGPGVLFPMKRQMLRISFFNNEAMRSASFSRPRIQITTRPTRSLY